ncbi:hypothetical protein BCR35DRAFT_311735 [Leucosporidium creatinivorum]|uniref:Uncharacterized protein n=1 Tax=Leucosporidium creatinivorum TaxID=106004 RepID=A0A1Y2G492_9BASI|nr:hypothetical protein BCR35DRAFT_311735 [Leucosporidium creatinivorum]
MESLLAETQSHLQQFDPAKTVPRACAGDVEDLEADDMLKRERFQHHAPSLLQLSFSLTHLLPSPSQSSDDLMLRSRLLLVFGRFTQLEQSEGFSSTSSVLVSSEICSLLLSFTIRRPLIHHTLSKTFPPLFKAHPKLNPSTGRVLSRPVGGDNAMTDWYEEGDEDDRSWRTQPGLGNVVRVVVLALEKNETEDLWPLLLPPLLAYLDDYHPPNKLIGVTILEALLPQVDSSLLIRTGVGKVFEQVSSHTTFTSTFLTNPPRPSTSPSPPPSPPSPRPSPPPSSSQPTASPSPS